MEEINMEKKTTDKKRSLAGQIALAQAEMPHAEMKSENPFFNNKYAGLTEVIDAVRPALNKHGIAVIQTPQFYRRHLEEGGTEYPPIMVLRTSLMFEEEVISSEMPLMYKMGDMQSMVSAMTYAKRSSLQSFLTCGGGADDDGVDAVGKDEVAKKAGKAPAKKAARPAQPQPELIAEGAL